MEVAKPSPASATPMQVSRSQQRPPTTANGQAPGQPGVGTAMNQGQATSALAHAAKMAESQQFGQHRQLQPREKEDLSRLVKELEPYLKQFSAAVKAYADFGSGEERFEANLQKVIKAQKVFAACINQQTWVLKDVIVVPPDTLQQMLVMVRRVCCECNCEV